MFDHVATIESSWSAYKSAVDDTCTSLPVVSSAPDPDWVLRNLFKKISSAWIHYHKAAKQGHAVSRHKAEYKHYYKLTK